MKDERRRIKDKVVSLLICVHTHFFFKINNHHQNACYETIGVNYFSQKIIYHYSIQSISLILKKLFLYYIDTSALASVSDSASAKIYFVDLFPLPLRNFRCITNNYYVHINRRYELKSILKHAMYLNKIIDKQPLQYLNSRLNKHNSVQ